MAHQPRNGMLDNKNSQKALSVSSSPNSLTSKHNPTKLPHQRHPPLQVSFVNIFADKHVSWIHKAWTSLCNALHKQEVIPHEELVIPNTHVSESSPQAKFSHQSKLEALPSLGKHILLYISAKSLSRGHALCHRETSCECNSGSNVDGFVNLNDDVFASSFVGVFLQAYTKDGVNLAHRLLDGRWAQRSLHSLAFARLQGEPGMICAGSSQPQLVDFDEAVRVEHDKKSTPLPLISLHRLLLRSFKDQILHAVPHHHHQREFPDKEMLNSVQDFFMYTEFEGRKVFEELDRDADGKLTVDDLKVAMKKMKLPVGYAKDFMQSRHLLWPAKYFGWSDFSSLLQEKEPTIVQLFNSLGVSKSGTVRSSHVKDSLVKAGLGATEANVTAMMNFLAEDVGDGLKYGQFRRFMLLVPTEQLTQDPWSIWLKAATTRGVEPLSEDWQQLSTLNYISSVSRNLSHHFQSAKGHSHP